MRIPFSIQKEGQHLSLEGLNQVQFAAMAASALLFLLTSFDGKVSLS